MGKIIITFGVLLLLTSCNKVQYVPQEYEYVAFQNDIIEYYEHYYCIPNDMDVLKKCNIDFITRILYSHYSVDSVIYKEEDFYIYKSGEIQKLDTSTTWLSDQLCSKLLALEFYRKTEYFYRFSQEGVSTKDGAVVFSADLYWNEWKKEFLNFNSYGDALGRFFSGGGPKTVLFFKDGNIEYPVYSEDHSNEYKIIINAIKDSLLSYDHQNNIDVTQFYVKPYVVKVDDEGQITYFLDFSENDSVYKEQLLIATQCIKNYMINQSKLESVVLRLRLLGK